MLFKKDKELNRYSKEGTIYRIELVRIGDDPRETLREDTQLDAAQYAELQERLARLDRASAQAPGRLYFCS
ncbi:hypothetical protein [Paenibacillus sp. 1P07SE]|uniref:hypothetical protein n=1 Tax=Paenibacillus sp. 1P07SE TaxID=3132209 RepID=UPI0039A4304A